MVTTYLYVEGGGDARRLKLECEQSFSALLRKAGFRGKMPRIVACGSRFAAFDNFRTRCEQGGRCLLLVDSEVPVRATSPWLHLENSSSDHWIRPHSARDQECHLMVVCMESWLLADRAALRSFFGTGFSEGALPQRIETEEISKADVFNGLNNATRHCVTKRPYNKSEHSFKILATVDPDEIKRSSPWARRFFEALNDAMSHS